MVTNTSGALRKVIELSCIVNVVVGVVTTDEFDIILVIIVVLPCMDTAVKIHNRSPNNY